MRFTHKQILENHARLEERNAVYRRYGYNSLKAVRLVLACARPLAGRVLEIGTGKGRFLVELARRIPRVVTVDRDAALQRAARLSAAHAGLGRKIRFVTADAADLPFADASFDAVVSMNALHHIRNPAAVLDEILRVVKPGGRSCWPISTRAGSGSSITSTATKAGCMSGSRTGGAAWSPACAGRDGASGGRGAGTWTWSWACGWGGIDIGCPRRYVLLVIITIWRFCGGPC